MDLLSNFSNPKPTSFLLPKSFVSPSSGTMQSPTAPPTTVLNVKAGHQLISLTTLDCFSDSGSFFYSQFPYLLSSDLSALDPKWLAGMNPDGGGTAQSRDSVWCFNMGYAQLSTGYRNQTSVSPIDLDLQRTITTLHMHS